MIHKFSQSLQRERAQAERADLFYREVLEVTQIQRFNTDSDQDMLMQRADVDLVFERKGVSYRVSEKFREVDYGDLYIELYSKYPNTLGWLDTGTPNAILYFTPSNVYWITHKSLVSFCHDTLFPTLNPQWIKDLYLSHETHIKKEIVIHNQKFSVQLIQAHNFEGVEWETIGIAVPFKALEICAVKFKRFHLNK